MINIRDLRLDLFQLFLKLFLATRECSQLLLASLVFFAELRQLGLVLADALGKDLERLRGSCGRHSG